MFWARAAWIAPLSRGFMAGSGRPIFAAAGVSRASFEKSLERFFSWAPLRDLMFFYFEWPAMAFERSYGWRVLWSRLIGVGPGKIQRGPDPRGLRKALTLSARQLKTWSEVQPAD